MEITVHTILLGRAITTNNTRCNTANQHRLHAAALMGGLREPWRFIRVVVVPTVVR